MSGILTWFVVAIHMLVCVALMVVILLQSGKGGGLAGAFGAGSSQTLFGGRGAASFLSRATTVLAVVFFLTSLTLGMSASRSGKAAKSLINQEAQQRAQQRAAQQGAGAPSAPITAPVQSPGTQAPGQGPAPAPSQALPAPPAPGPTPAPSGGTGK